jgi:hypothetical protein
MEKGYNDRPPKVTELLVTSSFISLSFVALMRPLD